jgi:predicted metal-dependent hydrolase
MAAPAAEREAVFQRGLEAYRAGLHYEAHEFWEELWEDEEDDDHRRFLQALIQVASAVHKVRANVAPRGALRLLDRAIGRMEGLPDAYGGVALARFREATGRCLAELTQLIAEGRHDLDPGLIPALDPTPDALPWRARAAEAPPNARRHLQAGVAAYRRKHFYEAHELWEVVWRDETHPMMKAFLQGLILVAAAMHKLERMGSASGAARLMESARARLAEVPEGTGGMDIGRLREDIARARVEIERMAVEGGTELEGALVPRMDPLGRVPS